MSDAPLGVHLSTRAARRIALAAQGFARPRPALAGTRDVQRVVDTVGVVQIDSVNVVVRSQYLPFFSRLGPYDRALLDRARDVAPRRVVEYWAHEASLVPPSTWPLLDFRMRRAGSDAWGGMRGVARDHPELVAAVLAEVARRGPTDQPRGRGRARPRPAAGARGVGLELVAGQERPRAPVLGRRGVERRAAPASSSGATRCPSGCCRRRCAGRPSTSAARPSEEEAFRRLVEISARAHGVGSEQCLRDYFRLSPEQARPAIASLVSRRHPAAGDGRGLAPAGLPAPRRAAPPTGRPPGPCCRRSTRSSGSATAPGRSSASTSGSRSTCPSSSGCTATTCCPSSSARTSWPGSTSSRTAPPGCCACDGAPGSPAGVQPRTAPSSTTSSRRWPLGCSLQDVGLNRTMRSCPRPCRSLDEQRRIPGPSPTSGCHPCLAHQGLGQAGSSAAEAAAAAPESRLSCPASPGTRSYASMTFWKWSTLIDVGTVRR